MMNENDQIDQFRLKFSIFVIKLKECFLLGGINFLNNTLNKIILFKI